MQNKVRNLGKRLQNDPCYSFFRQAFHRLRNEYNRTLTKKKSIFIHNITNQLNKSKDLLENYRFLKKNSLNNCTDHFSDLLDRRQSDGLKFD